MLTLAAMHVLDDTSDPYYTSLQAGAYQSKRPQGMPCDAAYQQGCGGPQLDGLSLVLREYLSCHWLGGGAGRLHIF